MYRFDAAGDGSPSVTWRETYDNVGFAKPGQSEKGSGTTPTVMDGGYVAITDNADPMNVLVYKKDKDVTGNRLICTQPVFKKGESNTDQSLIAFGRSIITENNYGYSGPTAVEQGGITSPGIDRVDVNHKGDGCRLVWHSDERAPSVVPKLSLGNGLVYVYTKGTQSSDPWYLTALDFRTGETEWKFRVGNGLGFNNNYAPVTIGPDGTAYVGTLGGLVLVRDKKPRQRGGPGAAAAAAVAEAPQPAPPAGAARGRRHTPGDGGGLPGRRSQGGAPLREGAVQALDHATAAQSRKDLHAERAREARGRPQGGAEEAVQAAVGSSRMGFFDGLKGMTGSVDQGLLQNGTPGTAICTSIQDTGVSMNEDLVVKFGLRVEIPGQAPYDLEHKQRVPRILMAQVSPGSVYAVKVDPSNPSKVVIDWSSAPAPPQGAIPMGGGAVAQPEYASAAEILATGAPGTATIQSAQQLPMTSPEGWPLYLLNMTVQLEGGAATPVQNGQKVPPDQTGRMVPGAQVPVKADPSNPMKCAIDWEAAGAAPAAPPAGGAEEGEDDPLDRIKKLQELREAGALTDAEFEAQKAKLLADI